MRWQVAILLIKIQISRNKKGYTGLFFYRRSKKSITILSIYRIYLKETAMTILLKFLYKSLEFNIFKKK
jgi:hypothetical protein